MVSTKILFLTEFDKNDIVFWEHSCVFDNINSDCALVGLCCVKLFVCVGKVPIQTVGNFIIGLFCKFEKTDGMSLLLLFIF